MAERLTENLTAHGPETPVDMDLMCAKLSWDIIGKLFFSLSVLHYILCWGLPMLPVLLSCMQAASGP